MRFSLIPDSHHQYESGLLNLPPDWAIPEPTHWLRVPPLLGPGARRLRLVARGGGLVEARRGLGARFGNLRVGCDRYLRLSNACKAGRVGIKDPGVWLK